MKTLILAAGFGTRLLPHTQYIPKPLFSIGGRTLLDRIIGQLLEAGCREVIINAHHLHEQIERFVATRSYPIPVHTLFEPVILGTGGAIKNASIYWDDQPLMVVNSDIVTDIDLRAVYAAHRKHGDPATLVLHDYPEFNTVSVDPKGLIQKFHEAPTVAPANAEHAMRAFTGIQVIDPVILDFIPGNGFFNSIDAYRQMIARGYRVRAVTVNAHYWRDVGTPERFRQAAIEELAPAAFAAVGHSKQRTEITAARLKGDGSDRSWYRLSAGSASLVVADHGIQTGTGTKEIDSFVSIGRHLHNAGIPVPSIYSADRFSGLVFLQDLGDTHLQNIIEKTMDRQEIRAIYRRVIDELIRLSRKGAEGFDTGWTCQTAEYDRNLILEKECRYFVGAFLQGYLGLDCRFEDFIDEFLFLAEGATGLGINGFMHRDMQSRNIMVSGGRLYFIDFQGGRIGPLQYDLASLLIDPYTALSAECRNNLLEYCAQTVAHQGIASQKRLVDGYRYCAVTRNLQILGAFGFLSTVKGKKWFERYIPPAITTLKQNLDALPQNAGKRLSNLIASIEDCNRLEDN